MQGDERPAWFVGDLDDPWVAAIADRLPDSIQRRACPGEIPDAWIAEEPPPGVVVIHRAILTALDIQRIGRLRARGETASRVILCHGPHPRHDDVVRWSRLFDVVLPEATALDTIRRLIEPRPRPVGPRPLVQAISGLHDVRLCLGELILAAGYLVERLDDTAQLVTHGLALWEVPILDENWPERLRRWAQTSNVVALLGFADRETVAKSREAGAVACLEWPCELDDLIYVLDRAASLTTNLHSDAAHVLPPAPALLRRQSRAEVVDPRRAT